jgi:hypothetical protein
MEKTRKKREPLWRTHMEDTNALYSREVEPKRFHFIEVLDMDDACGRDNEGQPPFVVELSEVDLDALSEKTIEGAKRSCGWEPHDPDFAWPDSAGRCGDCGGAGFTYDGVKRGYVCMDCDTVKPENWRLAFAEMCHQYGHKAPLDSWTGGRVRKERWDSSDCPRELLRAAKRRSRELDDPRERMEALSKPVNAIGSTALEYMQGDIHSAMERGVRKGDPKAKLMAKIHGASDENIAVVEAAGPESGRVARITMGKVPSDDPLAYTMGFMSGRSGAPLDANRDELAEAYIEGYQHGTKVRLGEEPQPDWAR